MLPTPEDCQDGCTLPSLGSPFHLPAVIPVLVSSLPFALTFFIVAVVVHQKLFPRLSGQPPSDPSRHGPPTSTLPAARWSPARPKATAFSRGTNVAAVAFSMTVALAAVLAELILCEISNSLNPVARSWSLQVTLSTLLVLLIVVIPLVELRSIISSAGWRFSREGARPSRLAWTLQLVGFGMWIAGFWFVGHGLPSSHVHAWGSEARASLREACLERIGIIGICLMALLSGFASVSAPWQTFGAKVRPVAAADIERKQAGMDATGEMLEAKQSRLRALSRKMSDAPAEGFMSKFMGSIRGNADVQERTSLELEISGLQTMHQSLSTSLSLLQERRRTQQRASTSVGRVLLLASYLFSIYCLYRILATLTASLRRWWHPDVTFSGTDPINNFLAVIAKHWDPSLDRLAWSRQISFFLSGVILLASFSSVMQTFVLLSRFTPALLQHTQANLALVVSQISATYVISSALLLRSNLPPEVSTVISDALGAPLDSVFVDRWFEGWFLVASGLTIFGIFVGRKLAGHQYADLDDDRDDVELGDKRL
ncbi:MAG: hypothetical protein M1838_000548 [Thelocarpon superellum]|nr:MAG: hypothetical protein M1838_000548 [Thelocarpon superellum]